MKKIFFTRIAGLMVLAIVFAMTGCGNRDMIVLTPNGDAIIQADGTSNQSVQTGSSQTASASKTSTTDTKQETEKPAPGEKSSGGGSSGSGLIRVGFAEVGTEAGWRLAHAQSMKEAFSEANGYQLDFVDCNNDLKTQVEAVQKFIDDKVDYIVLDPIIEDGYDDVLKNAQAAGIPVIVTDRNISADESLYACWVGSNFVQEGIDAANWLVEDLKKKGRDSEDINIVTILGTNGASAATGRTEGFEKVAKDQPHWKLLDKQSGDFSKAGGTAVMKVFLKQYDDIDVLVCQNDDEAFGAIEVLKDAGLTCGPEGDIILISYDATGDGFKAMIAGDINVDVECNPLAGPFVADLIQKLEAGEKVDKIQYLEEGVFPAETAEEILPSRAY